MPHYDRICRFGLLYAKSQIRMYNQLFRHISRLFTGRIAKKPGCRTYYHAQSKRKCPVVCEKPPKFFINS